ncbi:MAG TPA: LptF/LptG family permease [bacterium]|nr:LptF/LptG family permease [bacterium]
MLKIKYVLFSFFKIFCISTISFILIFVFARIADDISDAIRMGEKFVIWQYAYDIPEIFVEISPVMTFLSVMFLLSEMLKYGELKVLEISGINHMRFFFIMCLCGILISSLSFYVGNFVVPCCMKKKNKIGEIKAIHFSSPEYLLYSEKFVHPCTFEKIELSMILENQNIEVVKAESAIYQGTSAWLFNTGTSWIFDGKGNLMDTDIFSSKTYRLKLEPGILIASSKTMDTMTYGELKQLASNMERLGILSASMESYIHERAAYPLLNFFMLFILLPFFSLTRKISRVFVLSSSIILSFIAYGIYALGCGLAVSGKFPSALGVWLLHILIIFMISAYFYKLQKMRKSYII